MEVLHAAHDQRVELRFTKLFSPEKDWNKPQPCGSTSTGGAHRRDSHCQSWYNRLVLWTGLQKKRRLWRQCGTMDRTGGRTIGHEVITPEYMATGGNQGEISRHREMGQTFEYNTCGVPGRINPGCNGMDNNGTHTKGWRRVHRHMDG